MDVKLLGLPETVPPIEGGRLRRVKERCLLAVLALTPGQVVTADTLISKVWDDNAPSRGTLPSYVARVKAAVASVGGASVESVPGGYVLRIDPENVDVHRFHRLARQAEASAASGDAERAVSLLREAEGLWRDQALAGLPGRRIESIRHSLHEERRRALQRRVGLELGLGKGTELIVELAELAQWFPDDETWVGYRMRALYRAGRKADALAVYRRNYEYRRELGLGTSPDLEALEGQIHRDDASLKARPSDRRLVRRASRNGGLPPRPDAVVGRDGQLAPLGDPPDMGAPSVRIIHGMGGSGKTTLALEAAYRLCGTCPDPPLFLRFYAHEAGHDPLSAREALSQLLELSGITPMPSSRDAAALAAAWQREIAERRSVIVLDDVPDAAAIASIVPTAGESVVIVTSRFRLAGPPGSVVISLEELAEDDAIVLFTQTAGFSKIDDTAALRQAVRLCGYLPIALVATASRLRGQRAMVSKFVAAIEEQRAFSDHASMTVPELAETFEPSCAGLDRGQMEFFRRLGASPCPDFSPLTAAALVGTTVKVAETALAVLYARHLIERSSSNRYRFHDLVREYAEFVADRDGPGWERRQAIRRLLRYYLNSSRRADELLYPYRKRLSSHSENSSIAEIRLVSADSAMEWFKMEWPNVVRLADYVARHEWVPYCADLSDAITGFLDSCGHWNAGIELHQTALRVCRDIDDPIRLAGIAKSLSLFEWRTGNYKNALLHAEEAAEIYRSVSEGRGVAESLDRVGVINFYMGHASAALAYHQEALELYQELSERHGAATAHSNMGAAYYSLGRYSETVVRCEDATILYQEVGDRRGEARCANNIGDALLRQGLHRDAVRSYEKALQIYRELDARQHVMTVRLNIAHVDQDKGRYREAVAVYRATLQECREIGDPHLMARTLYDIGTAYQRQEYYGQALTHYQEAGMIAEELGYLGMQAIVRLGIADASRGIGDYNKALEYYSSAIDAALRTDDLLQKAKALEGMAETRYRLRDITAARILLREAVDAFEAVGVPEAGKAKLRLASLGSGQI